MNAKHGVKASVIVAALGYFVDVYDLILFSVVRTASLHDLGLEGDALLTQGVFLLNMQMAGMLTGGILWGIWGDKRGRVSVLFGSILLYSIANICNGLVQSVDTYAYLRFIAGVGLAGEIGAGITLVSEIMDKESRGYGTTIVAAVGVLGAVMAALVGDPEVLHWRTAYFLGGAMGLVLLVMRVIVYESGLYERVDHNQVSCGRFLDLFRTKERAIRYLSCILSGLPIWFAIGILVTFSPELAKALGIVEPVSAGNAVFYTYCGLVVGDVASGLLSQYLGSRKKVIALFLALTACSTFAYLNLYGSTPTTLYILCLPLGFSVGYWAVFVTTAAEQFGTNLRATVTTTVPNFVRGSTVPITLLFNYLKPSAGIIGSAFYVGTICFLLALLALFQLKESFMRDLDFVEQ